jgi:hypothetical protein
MVDSSVITDVIIYILLPWIIIIERRLSRLEGGINMLIKMLDGEREE